MGIFFFPVKIRELDLSHNIDFLHKDEKWKVILVQTSLVKERMSRCELETECEIQVEIRSLSRDDMHVFAHQDCCI